MLKLFSHRALSGLFAGLLLLAATASAQVERLEVGGNYTYVRVNAPPGGCGCLSLNGGSAWIGYNFTHSLALVGEVGSDHASDIDGTTTGFTMTSFLVGPRYSFRRSDRIVPFGQVLLGGAHGNGALTPNEDGAPASANSFAMTAGGGLDVGLTRHVALRLAQVDYYMTRFDNDDNYRQNNLRVGAGLIFRFGGEK